MPNPDPLLTTVDLVRVDLVARLGGYLTSAGIEDAELAYGVPSSDWPKYCCVGSTREPVEMDHRTAPARVRESQSEDYTLDVVFWQLAANQFDVDAQKACVESVFAMFRAAVGGLRAAPAEYTLGGLVTWARFVDYKPSDFYVTEGRAAQIVAGLAVHVHRL